MSRLSMIESQGVAEIATILYDFLPASFSAITWPVVAERCGVFDCWPAGLSKKQSIPVFLRQVLEFRREKFCDMIEILVQEGIVYKSRKNEAVTREQIEKLNLSLLKVQFKIPKLNDNKFLENLPSSEKKDKETVRLFERVAPADIEKLRLRFLKLSLEGDSQVRGFEFESFLKEFFQVHGLNPKGAFRRIGEQIDGSFEWEGNTYLIEARWRSTPANAADLMVLRGKAEKSEWTRGLFISMNGFSEQSMSAFQIGRKANLIAMSGQDLMLILEGRWGLIEALRAKLRHTGETAEAYIPLSRL